MKMEQTECSEMSAYKIHTPGNYPECSIHHSEHGEKFAIKNLTIHLAHMTNGGYVLFVPDCNSSSVGVLLGSGFVIIQ